MFLWELVKISSVTDPHQSKFKRRPTSQLNKDVELSYFVCNKFQPFNTHVIYPYAKMFNPFCLDVEHSWWIKLFQIFETIFTFKNPTIHLFHSTVSHQHSGQIGQFFYVCVNIFQWFLCKCFVACTGNQRFDSEFYESWYFLHRKVEQN